MGHCGSGILFFANPKKALTHKVGSLNLFFHFVFIVEEVHLIISLSFYFLSFLILAQYLCLR